MSIRGKTEGRLLTLYLTGDIDHHRVKELMGEVDQRIDLELPCQLVLNLAQVGFMDSSGIALILRSWKRMQELDGTLRLEEITPQPGRVIRAAGLMRMMEVKPKEEQA